LVIDAKKREYDVQIGFKRQLLIVGGGLVLVVSGVVLLAGNSMRMLSAVRSYVGAESLWSKGQKDSVMELNRYAESHDEAAYGRFLAAIRVPLGDEKARVELDKPRFDKNVIRGGFLEGGNHPDDVEGMIWLYLHFHDSRYLRASIENWTEADKLVQQIAHAGEEIHALALSGQANSQVTRRLIDQVKATNTIISPLSESFSHNLGNSAREIENVLLMTLVSTAGILLLVGCWAYFLVFRNVEKSDREIRASRDRALDLSRVKGQFVANMSHEIRTPMNGVLGMLQLLIDTPLTVEQHEFAQIAHDSGVALLDIINDILDLSRMEAGKLEVRSASFRLREIVSGVEMLLKDQARRKHVALSSTIDSKIPTLVFGDAPRLRQILMNLVGNALKFTAEGSVEVIVMQLASERVRFEVCDTGIGIAPGVEKRLFEAFSQADGSITRKYGGAGLGLAISSQLIGLMGGEIGVESKLGHGSKFWFEVGLPADTRRDEISGTDLFFAPSPLARLK
jgi:signal transduction histidine kinase